MGFISGEFGGHSRSIISLSSNHPFVTRAVWIVALSCWKMTSFWISSGSVSIKDGRYSSKIVTYCTAFICPWQVTKGPPLLLAKQAQTIIDTPLHLSFGLTFLGLNFSMSPGARNTHICRGSPPFSTEHSSDHINFLQSSTVKCKCSLEML